MPKLSPQWNSSARKRSRLSVLVKPLLQSAHGQEGFGRRWCEKGHPVRRRHEESVRVQLERGLARWRFLRSGRTGKGEYDVHLLSRIGKLGPVPSRVSVLSLTKVDWLEMRVRHPRSDRWFSVVML